LIRAAAALAATLIGMAASTAAHAEAPEPRPNPTEVVVVKRAGVTAYEEVSEEFSERCRVRARVISFGDEGMTPQRARIGKGELVVTVGQEALDAVTGRAGRVIPTLAFHTPPGLLGPPAAPPPELLLKVLHTARSSIKSIGVVYGPRSQPQIEIARRAAEKLGVTLIATRVGGGPAAVRGLRALVDKVQAIWLPGDTDVITPQVFQYALQLQLERGLPVAAATRQQVHSGALLAVDFAPRSAGRAAANIANRFLEGRAVSADDEVELYGGARISVNAQVARRLGLDTQPLERMGAKVE
jgi:hypothetical protein